MNRALLIAGAMLLSTCNVIPEQEPVDLYQLPPPNVEATNEGPRLTSLRIDQPMTSEALGGNRLLVMPVNNQFQAFPGVRLATPVPLLWRDWLLDAFWRDGRIDGLSVASEGLRTELELGGMLRAFHVDYTGPRPQAVIQFDATLIDTAGRDIIARRRFEARQTMDSMEVAIAINSLGAAADQLAGQLIAWTLEQGQ